MSDIDAGVCRAPDKTDETAPALPRFARLPINRCNLPAAILGGLTYQRHPTPLTIRWRRSRPSTRLTLSSRWYVNGCCARTHISSSLIRSR